MWTGPLTRNSTDCCPTTATVTVSACPSCDPSSCTIATETSYEFTGCADVTPAGYRTSIILTKAPAPTGAPPAEGVFKILPVGGPIVT